MRFRAMLATISAAALAACDASAPLAPAAAPPAPSLARGGGFVPFPDFPPTDPLAEAVCGVTVGLTVVGSYKILPLPDGRMIYVVPANTTTWTNLDTGASVTVSTTGTLHTRPLPNGGTEQVYVGHSGYYDPFTNTYDYLSGRFVVVVDANGQPVGPLQGTGKRTSVCDIIAPIV